MNTISNENFRLKKEEELSPAVKTLSALPSLQVHKNDGMSKENGDNLKKE